MSLNLSSLCRLCMSETKPLFALFSHKDNIAEKVTELLPLLKLSENDGLPSKLCESCLQNINIFYDFKIQCEISEETLRNYLASQLLVFKSCWNHESPSSSKTKEEQQNEQLTNFTECKTEIDVTDDVKSEPEDVTADVSATLLENNMEQPQKEKKNVESNQGLEEEEPAYAPVVDEHSTPTISQEKHLKQSQKEKKKQISKGTRDGRPFLQSQFITSDCISLHVPLTQEEGGTGTCE